MARPGRGRGNDGNEGDLPRLFAANRPEVSAQRIFADRDDERVAFDRAVQAHLAELAALRAGEWDAQDLDRPRRNVLAFHGVGGIGKTTLVERLAERLDTGRSDQAAAVPWPALRTTPWTFSVAAIDLQRSALPTLERILLDIRASLAETQRRFVAFDLLFGAYWSQAHPHEDLRELLRRRTPLARLSRALGIPDHMEAAIGDVGAQLAGASSIGSSLARSVRLLLDMVHERRLSQHTLGRCRLLAELLRSAPTLETLSYAPYVLAWDLAELQRDETMALVVVLDTFEHADRELELHLQRLVWLMPNALFVISGRHRLDWADSAVSGPGFRSGPHHWPGLARAAESTSRRQHLVGFLSDTDAAAYLRASLTGPFGEEVITDVVRTAGGLPLHLDLVVQRWAQVRAHRPPGAHDVALEFPELARRMLRDLSSDERRALMACCLFDVFDVELVRVAADLPVSGPVRRLFAGPLVNDAPSAPGSYALHETIRRRLLRAHVGPEEHEWSRRDLEAAAARGLDELQARLHGGHRAHADVPIVAMQSFSLARTFGLDCPWLVDLADEVTRRGAWSPSWRASPIPIDPLPAASRSWVDVLADGLAVVMGRQVRHRAEVAADLGRLLDEHADPSGRLDVLRYFYAEAARDSGMLPQSRATLEDLRSRGGRMGLRAVHGLLHLLRREGRFGDFLRLLDAYSGRLPAAHRLRGDLLWTQARFHESAASYRRAREHASADATGHAGEAALCAVSEAYALGFVAPEVARSVLSAGGDRLDSSLRSFAYGLYRTADALVVAGTRDAPARIQRARAVAAQAGHSSLVAYVDLVEAFDATLSGDTERHARAVVRLRRQVRGRAFAYLVEIACTWSDGLHPGVPSSDWTDDRCLTRWSELAVARRAVRRATDPPEPDGPEGRRGN